MLLADMHLRGASIADIALPTDTQLEIAAAPSAMFHLLLQAPAPVPVSCGDQTLMIEPGDVLVFPSGSAHVIARGSQIESLSFGDEWQRPITRGDGHADKTIKLMSARAHFDEELARPFMTALPVVFRVPGEKGFLPPWIAIGVQFIREALQSSLPAHQAIINRVAEILLIECLRRYVARIPADSQSWLRALRDPAISRALAALHRTPAHPWTVELLAREANLSRSAFAQRFAQCMDQTPMAYLTGLRLRKAAWQLRHTAQPVARIAEEAGYSSSSAFTQAFERSKGCSPRAYRDAASMLPS